MVLRGGTRLAGSSLRMDHAIANVIRWADVSLAEAVTMASKNAARVGRVAREAEGSQAGERADLVRFKMEDGSVRVLETLCCGGPGLGRVG